MEAPGNQLLACVNFRAVVLFARTTSVIFEETKSNISVCKTIPDNVFFKMRFLFLLQGCDLSCIVDLFAVLHDLASACACTLLKLAPSVRASLKSHGTTLKNGHIRSFRDPYIKAFVIKVVPLFLTRLPKSSCTQES